MGLLRKSDTNKYTNKACSKFYKFVLDNGATPKEKNRKIQVIAWNENIKLIDDCNKVNMVSNNLYKVIFAAQIKMI